MRKANELRSWLVASVPFLTRDPDKLQVFLDAGSIAARAGTNLSFEYRYSLSVLICDYSGHADEIVIPMLAWIEREQPDLLIRSDRDEAFRFEAEILDGTLADLSFTIEISEPVVARRRADNSGFDVTHPAPPPWPGELAPGLDASLLQGYAWRDLVSETRNPDAVLVPGIPPEAGS